MYNKKFPDIERVRIDFTRALLNAASKQAAKENQTLSTWINDLVADELQAIKEAAA